MSDIITMPAPVIEDTAATQTKWEREYHAFRRLLPQLLATHRGRYVAIHQEEVADSGDEKLAPCTTHQSLSWQAPSLGECL